MVKNLIVIIACCCPLAVLRAGVIELGAQGSYHTTTLKNSSSITRSVTGSLSYYFWELSAIEFSYTNGRTEAVSDQKEISQKIETISNFELYGADFVLTLASKNSAFRPYIKAGGLYIKQSISYRLNEGTWTIDETEGSAPSAGIGFRLLLSQNFAIKAGVDAWSSPTQDDDTKYDFAGRAGISWLF